MLRLFIYLIVIITNHQFVFSSETDKYSKCSWANSSTPCVKIEKRLNNSSYFNEKFVNKYIVTKEKIDEIGATNIVDVLKTIPGINLTQSGPSGQQTSVFLRGTGSNHTLVMINGIPINDQSTTQGLHDFGVEFIQTIQQIEVYPGSSGTHFGTNAIGGAINIILSGDYVNQFNISGDKDKNYSLSSNNTIFKNDSIFNFKLGVVKKENISARQGTEEDKDKVQNYSVNINHEKFISTRTKLFNTIFLRQTLAEYDGSSTNQTGYKGDNKMMTLQSGLNNFKSNSNGDFVFYFTKYDREYDERGTIDNYYSNVVGSKYNYSSKLNQKFSYGFGADYKYEWGKFDNRGSYQASTKGNVDNFAVFGNFGFEFLRNTFLSFFARNDDHKQTGNNYSYKLGLNKVFEKFTIGLARMTGLRNPSLYELYGTDNFGFSGNRDLKPEKSQTDEINLTYQSNNNLTLSTNLFRSNINNNIEYLNGKYINDSDNINLNQNGIENVIEYKASNTRYSFFSTFLSSKKEDGSDQLRRPEKSYGFNFNRTFFKSDINEFNLNINYKHYGKHFDTHSSNFNTIEMDSTDIVNLSLNKKFNYILGYIKIDNLFDQTYQRPHGYNQEKRYLTIGFNYKY